MAQTLSLTGARAVPILARFAHIDLLLSISGGFLLGGLDDITPTATTLETVRQPSVRR